MPHLHTGTGLTPATSAPGPGSPLPHLPLRLTFPFPIYPPLLHLHRDWAHPSPICAGIGFRFALAFSAPDWEPPVRRDGGPACPSQT